MIALIITPWYTYRVKSKHSCRIGDVVITRGSMHHSTKVRVSMMIPPSVPSRATDAPRTTPNR